MAEHVGLRGVAEGLVQHAGPGYARTLDRDVEKSCAAAVAGQPVGRPPVDPCLPVGEVGAVAAELAGRAAEGVQRGIAGVAGLERQIESLAQVLSEKAKRVDTLRAGSRVRVFEDLLPGALQLFAE